METANIFRTRGGKHHRDVVCSDTDKAWERECGRRSNRPKRTSHPSIRVGNPSVGSRWSREVRSLRFNLKQNKRNDKHTHTSPRHKHTFHSVTDTHLSLSLTPTNIMIMFCTLTWPHTWPKLTDYQSIIDEPTLLSINFWSDFQLKLGVLMNTQVNKLLWMERPSHYL